MTPGDHIERPIRMPKKLYARLQEARVKSKRSGNAEMVFAIEKHLDETENPNPRGNYDRTEIGDPHRRT
jgi:predicted DNA-binding protein